MVDESLHRFENTRVFRTIAPDRIYSGTGCIEKLPSYVKRSGAKNLLVATSNSVHNKTPNTERVISLLGNYDVSVYANCRQHSPEEDVLELMELINSTKVDMVVSVGGSSVFDTVKVALSRLTANATDKPIPQIAVPTTLSAGEFSPGAGYTRSSDGTKKLVVDMRMSPSCVFLDPKFTVDTPKELWLGTGIKAFEHAMEAVWSLHPHPYVDAIAIESIHILYSNLARSESKMDLEARAACQVGAWMSISGVGASGMRLSHFLGHQIGAAMHIPHGITSCVLLPTVMRYLAHKTEHAQLRVAQAMGIDAKGRSSAVIMAEAADRLETLIRQLELPSTITAAGGKMEDLDSVVRASAQAAIDFKLTEDLPEGEDSVREILLSAWG